LPLWDPVVDKPRWDLRVSCHQSDVGKEEMTLSKVPSHEFICSIQAGGCIIIVAQVGLLFIMIQINGEEIRASIFIRTVSMRLY
jgi:hypothetical protein